MFANLGCTENRQNARVPEIIFAVLFVICGNQKNMEILGKDLQYRQRYSTWMLYIFFLLNRKCVKSVHSNSQITVKIDVLT